MDHSSTRYGALLPVSRHSVSEEDVEAVVRVLRHQDLTRGREVRAFEEEFAAYVGARHAVACSSGTAALWLAVESAGAPADQPWLVPAITFAATRNAAKHHKIVDVDPSTGLIACGEGSGISNCGISVFYAGQEASIAPEPIIDAAHALGSQDSAGHKVGAGWTCCFSFVATKTITTGEGGMVTTNSADQAEHMRALRDNGIVRSHCYTEPWRYANTGFGLNFHMSEMAAALGRSQLKRIDSILNHRRRLAERYERRLGEAPVHRVIGDGTNNACHIYPVLIDFDEVGVPRSRVMYELAKRGIETQVHYIPLADLPGANEFYRRELTLPIHGEMEPSDVDHVCESLLEVTA